MDEILERLGWPRTRENYIRLIYDEQPPEGWDAECEEQLPEDLRLWPVPNTPFG